MRTAMNQLNCCECDASIDVPADTLAGEILECAECSVELEVVSLDPLSATPAPEVEEDWGE